MTDTPTHPIDKELVAKRFSYSRSTYDREASVQRQVAEKMMRLLTDALLSAGIPRPQLPTHFRHIVELGCGTGSYSRMLLNTLQPETLLLNDLCRDMEECVRELCTTRTPRVSFLPGDNLVLHPAMVQRPRCFPHPLPPSTGGRRPACLQHLRHHKHARNTPTDGAWAGLSLR